MTTTALPPARPALGLFARITAAFTILIEIVSEARRLRDSLGKTYSED